MSWAADVWEGFYTVLVGMKITWRHLFVDKVTLHYPEEKWQLPPRSRMRLFMKYEDCIGCGQCARACPVDCIYIKTDKRATGAAPIFAADGTPIKLDVKVFDIDMSLCCYCNLCTYPCPTNCIYMTPEYEFASTDITQHLYHFAKPNAKFLTVNPKAAAKPAAAASPAATAGAAAPAVKPAAAPAPLAPKPEIPPPSPGDVPKESPRTAVGEPGNPAPNVATGTPPSGVAPADAKPADVPPAEKPADVKAPEKP
jgi:NADH-quinone oxidoreductase subunit I